MGAGLGGNLTVSPVSAVQLLHNQNEVTGWYDVLQKDQGGVVGTESGRKVRMNLCCSLYFM